MMKHDDHRGRSRAGGTMATLFKVAAGGALAVLGYYTLSRRNDKRSAEARLRRLEELAKELRHEEGSEVR